ncbi:sugar phosphate isomerase/epimerase [Oceanotoga sp. DSM 15011]|uniref:sugar phosphate isomerase/epimerase family protein n=1 Tax=Oceanotoga sp. DSM 15011 TaxID=2984951 RepID=UPI0021F4D47F|nr:sugar phosphate isomerase/epimerase [Oceanotoga sp. DSM 15011]UYP00788.1 sugar phosphate isomerase/epimerase [Oceanotoga sp. DSM 15011]
MKLGVFTVVLGSKDLDSALDYLKKLGVQSVEIGAGGYPGTNHANPDLLLNNSNELQKFKDTINKYEMSISGISCHGNPVHPQKEIANKFHTEFEKAILLAEKLGVDTINGFSGCPGDSKNSMYPNWVVCPWPEDFLKILDFQWNDILIPYWENESKFAKDHGIKKIAFEMHPGFCVYNPETLLKLRNSVGDIIGANFDPSHLFWQGIDPVEAIKELGSSIYHFHAKDTKIDKRNTSVNGVLDTKHYGDEINRSWIFRTVGYGHDYQTWKDMISALRLIGYDGALSIEHEDSLMSGNEGLKKAISFLKEVLVFEKTNDMWWA